MFWCNRFSQLCTNMSKEKFELHRVFSEPMYVDDFFKKYNFGQIFQGVDYWQGATISFWVTRSHTWWPELQYDEIYRVEPRDIQYCDLSYVQLNVQSRLKACMHVLNFVYKITRFVISF